MVICCPLDGSCAPGMVNIYDHVHSIAFCTAKSYTSNRMPVKYRMHSSCGC